MKIIPVTNKKHDKSWYDPRMFYPVNDSDVKLFMHCTEGLIAASKEFLEAYAPVFENHELKVELHEEAA